MRLVDELWRHRPLRAHADAEGCGDHELEDVQRPDARMIQSGVRRQPEAARDHPDLLHEHHAPTIERIGDRSSDHGQGEKRDEMRERDEPDGERRAGQPVHLVSQRDFGDFRPYERDALPEPEPPERGMTAKRTDVERESRSTLKEAASLARSHPGLVRQDSLASSVPKPRTIVRVASATGRIMARGRNAARRSGKGYDLPVNSVSRATVNGDFRAHARGTILIVH